jgi:hypothetical protein
MVRCGCSVDLLDPGKVEEAKNDVLTQKAPG